MQGKRKANRLSWNKFRKNTERMITTNDELLVYYKGRYILNIYIYDRADEVSPIRKTPKKVCDLCSSISRVVLTFSPELGMANLCFKCRRRHGLYKSRLQKRIEAAAGIPEDGELLQV